MPAATKLPAPNRVTNQRRKREPKIKLPPSAKRKPGEELTEAEWQEKQDHQQKRAVELHLQRVERERRERLASNPPVTLGEQLDGTKEVNPELDAWQKQQNEMAHVEEGRVVVPARGPEFQEGRYIGDGQVPTTGRKKGKRAEGRVVKARKELAEAPHSRAKHAGRVAAARRKAALG